MTKIDWKRIITVVLDPCKEDRELWEKEMLKRTIQKQYGGKLIRAVEARKREQKVSV